MGKSWKYMVSFFIWEKRERFMVQGARGGAPQKNKKRREI